MNALSKIQQALKAPKGQKNKFGGYQYRSCEDILEAIKPLLAEDELDLIISDEVKQLENVPQMIITDDTKKPKVKSLVTASLAYVEATAMLYKDKELLGTAKGQAGIDVNKAGMDWAQCFGSSSSYARKYALNGLFCIDDTKDADATNDHGKATPAAKKATPVKLITAVQMDNLVDLISKANLDAERLQTGIEKLAGKKGVVLQQLTQPQAATFISQITKIIETNKTTTQA